MSQRRPEYWLRQMQMHCVPFDLTSDAPLPQSMVMSQILLHTGGTPVYPVGHKSQSGPTNGAGHTLQFGFAYPFLQLQTHPVNVVPLTERLWLLQSATSVHDREQFGGLL